MDRTELAWAAGFWDGEGSAYLSGSGERATKQPHARLNQSSVGGVPEVLIRFQRAVGFGDVKGPVSEPGREPLYRWEVSSRNEVGAVHHALLPWLGEVKREQFRRVLGFNGRPEIEDPTNPDEWTAWCAGLFDGEGSTCLVKHRSRTGYFVLEISITQSSRNGVPQVLARFRETLGIGFIYGPYPSSDGYAPVYRWRAYRREHVRAVLDAMGPHLGKVKRRQAGEALRVVVSQSPLPRGNPAWGNRKTHCVRGHEYATARIRPFKGRGRNSEAPRASHQCLACVRDDARAKRKQKSGG